MAWGGKTGKATMRRTALGTVTFLAVGLLALPARAGSGGVHKLFRALVTPGTTWSFVVTIKEGTGSTRTVDATWHIDDVAPFGKGKKVTIVVTERDPSEGSAVDREIEYVIIGSRLYDVGRLEPGRPVEDVSPAELAKWPALIDASKLKKKGATVVRDPRDPLAWTRFERLASFKDRGGTTWKGVIHATHRRGETDTTDEWWYSPRHGIVQLHLSFPALVGGVEMWWQRKPTPDGAGRKHRK